MSDLASTVEFLSDFCKGINDLNVEGVSVILIGSTARRTTTPTSDVDLVILGREKPLLPHTPDNYHVYALTEAEFRHRLEAADDLVAWSVRFGVVVQDSGLWSRLLESPEAQRWPNWQKKITHATRRLLTADLLLKTGDGPAAAEEILYAAGHLARALLLKKSIFPLSRVELIDQTQKIGYTRLSEILRFLIYADPDIRYGRIAISYLKKLLCELDRSEYKRVSTTLARLAPYKNLRPRKKIAK